MAPAQRRTARGLADTYKGGADVEDATRSGSSDQGRDDGLGRSLGLTREVRSLREELAELRRSLADEVRTRRLVVEEGDGFERCILAPAEDHATLLLRARSEPGATSGVELCVHDACEGDGPIVGMALLDEGNVVGVFDVVSGRQPTLWIDVTEDRSPT